MRKQIKENYWSETPKWARKFGDGLLAASLTITTYAIAQHNDVFALASLWLGVAGKFLTNLFKED
jgi:hypothetical protein